MRMRLSVWLENDEGKLLFGEGRQQILEAIAEHKSLSAAAEAMGMSYRGLWAKIRHSERRLGFPLIESHAGRGPSSGTSLSDQGRAMLERYAELRRRVVAAADEAFGELYADD